MIAWKKNPPMSLKVASKKAAAVGNGSSSAPPQRQATMTASYLSSASSGALLGRLLEVHTVLDDAPPSSSMPLDSALVHELIKNEYLESGNADIQAVVASILADVLRIGGGATSTQLPFPKNRAAAVLHFFAVVLDRVRTNKKPTTALLMHARHTVERLAMSHALQKLVASSPSADADDSTGSLFQTFLHDFTSVEEDASFLSRVSIVLADCIAATQTLTEGQLGMLLSAISVAKKHANPVGASIAVAVLRRNEEHLSGLIGNHLAHEYESGVEELKRVDITDGDANERRAALKQISGSLEIAIELARIGGSMVSHLLPQLQQGLTSDAGDVRLITVRGFAKIFGTSMEIVRSFAASYNLFLSRFSDGKPLIRQEMIKFAHTSLAQFPTDGNWQNLGPILEAKLVEADEGVRRSAISVICELSATTTVASTVPKALLEAVGQRCADKHPKVRAHATEKLMQLYRGHPNLSWIPDAVFLSIYGDGGVVALELGLEDMLPSPTKVAEMADKARKQPKNRKDSNIAVFDFEIEAQEQELAEHNVSEEALRAAAQKSSFIDAFCRLCGDLSASNFSILLVLMGKKRNLRQAVRRLFELRAEVKRIGNINSPEGKEASGNVVRLLTFLQNITHAKKSEWDTIFRAKDDKIAKAFQTAVDDEAQMDGNAAGGELVKKLQGRLTGDAFVFVQQGLVKRLFLPVSTVHAEELVSRLTVERSLAPSKRHGSLRAAACIVAAQPPLLTHLFPILVDTMSLEAGRDLNAANATDAAKKSPTKATISKANGDAQRQRQGEAQSHKDLLLTLLSTLAASADSDEGMAVSSSMLEQQSKTMIVAIGRMIIQTPFPDIAKRGAKVLCVLFPNHIKAFAQLVDTLREKLAAVASGSQPYQMQVASWLKAVTVLATSPHAKIRGNVTESLMDTVTTPLLFGAMRSSFQDDEMDAKSKKDDLLTAPSTSTAVVDACVKLMTRFALQQNASKASILVPKVVGDLVSAYRETKQLGTGTVGACRKRYAIAKQLIRLVAKPVGSFLDISHEMTVALVITAEDNATVRHALQRKVQVQILKQKSDVRMLALLILTAISEEHKSGYLQLRSIVHSIGEKMRATQVATEATLGEPRALFCYAEYTIPTLVLFLAHHTFLSSERDSGFMAFQRVWHLLFEELFRNGTNCASFCGEMLRKLKQLDDSLDPDSTATRMICDLASKVMIECLGQRSVRVDALKPYPGSVLLPKMFTVPRDAARFPADVVYLDASVVISAHPPFKAPLFGATPAKSLGAESTSAVPADDEEDGDNNAVIPSQTPRRALLKSVADNEEEDFPTTVKKRNVHNKQQAVLPSPPSTSRKRSRAEASAPSPDAEEDVDEVERDCQVIYRALVDILGPLTAEQFSSKGWKALKHEVEAALGKKLTQPLHDYLISKLPEVQPRT